nr:MAG TPA: hypothetical protein [Caudoviricetes sp.]
MANSYHKPYLKPCLGGAFTVPPLQKIGGKN